MGRVLRTRRIILTAVTFVLAVVGLAPIIVMFARSLIVDGGFSLECYRQVADHGALLAITRQQPGIGVVDGAVVHARGVAAGVAACERPICRCAGCLSYCFALPLVIPPYITAVSWSNVLGPANLAAGLWGEPTAQLIARLLFGLPGCVLVMVSTFMPAILLATLTFVRTVNPRLEEAGRLSARPLRVLWGVTIPLVRPGVLLAATLVFLLALGEFGVPTFLRYNVFPVESFAQFSAFYNFGAATAAAVPLALLTFVVLGVEWFALREKVQALRPAPESGGTVIIRLGQHRMWFFGLVSVFCALMVVSATTVATGASRRSAGGLPAGSPRRQG